MERSSRNGGDGGTQGLPLSINICIPLQPVSIGPKCLSIAKVIWYGSHYQYVNRMARLGIDGIILERETLQLKGGLEVVTVWFLFLWPLYIYHSFCEKIINDHKKFMIFTLNCLYIQPLKQVFKLCV
jgi:hypothetical protein